MSLVQSRVLVSRIDFVIPLNSWDLFFDSLVVKVWKHYLTEVICESVMPSVCAGSN